MWHWTLLTFVRRSSNTPHRDDLPLFAFFVIDQDKDKKKMGPISICVYTQLEPKGENSFSASNFKTALSVMEQKRL